MNTDMTKGTPSKVLLLFTVPMLLSAVFQQFYNLTDSVVVGQFVGEGALAAVGASYPITMIFIAIAQGCNIGCGVVVSQLFGGKDYKRLKTAVTTALIATVFAALILTVVGLAACAPLMRLMGTPPDIFADSMLYLNIYIVGLIFVFLYNICTGVFTALGDSKTPLYFLIGSSLSNIIVDVIFVAKFDMGVAGVAWATFLCQGVAAVLSVIAVYKRIHKIPTQEQPKLFCWHELQRIATIAVPSILQQSFISIGNLFIQSLVNGYGSAVVAGYSAAIKLNTFAVVGFSTMAGALSSFTAQNIGAGKTNRVKQGFKAGTFITLACAVGFSGLYLFAGSQLIKLFLPNPTAEALEVGITFLKVVSPFFFLVAMKLLADGVLRGAGCMKEFMIATFTDLILRVALAYILAPVFGSSGIWMSWPIGWGAAAILSFIYFKVGRWEKKQLNITNTIVDSPERIETDTTNL